MELTQNVAGAEPPVLETCGPSLREEYARYFFSVFEAVLHDDNVGRREAQEQLEAALPRRAPVPALR